MYAARLSALAHGLLAALALAASLIPADPIAAFGWRRDRLEAEPWRALTGPLTHLDGTHLAFNLTGLFLLALAHRRLSAPPGYFAALTSAALAVEAALRFWRTDIAWYAGLSGILHGLALWLMLEAWQRRIIPAPLGAGLSLGLALKTLWEASAAVGSAGAFGLPQAPGAHLAGLIGGAASWLGTRLYAALQRPR